MSSPRLTAPSWSRLVRELGSHRPHWLTGLAIAVLVALVLAALLAPLLSAHDPVTMVPSERLRPPSPDHLLGTDAMGRDLWARVLWGARISLVVGAGATLGAVVIGLPLGLVSGYFRRLDPFVMRVMDGLMAIPGILLAVALIAIVRPSLTTVMIAILIPEIPSVVRLVRARVLSAREEPYVEAARLLGTGGAKMLWRHLLPNTVAPLVVQAAHVFAAAILTESALSFLGVGIGTETPSWGNVMADGRLYFSIKPALIFWPAAALTLTILSINIVGDALRDALDPKTSKGKG
ncbi:ABC transporter permease [Pinisolibacter aquiterrae]|uniref:ABC transporter permease n=1 Tax=Pinisolibacter aquiterrae TaxID=2815579 RepID=UPI001C3D380D|nr:ABC transporter permease [Pinisolibacter aquiterrae]MBV5264580.1 ABC transporter permease [Pinisolibacter aquiterrae]MCC8233349.1 ABC transporter permease [Pinisolibacter aquiterrae]